MGDEYSGKERRKDRTEMFNLVCSNKFNTIDTDIHRLKTEEIIPMREDVADIKKKVFNGLSDLPKQMNLLIILFITVLAGIGGLFWRQGQLSAMIEIQLERDVTVYEVPE